MWPTVKFTHLGIDYTPDVKVDRDAEIVVARPDLFTPKAPQAATKVKEP